MKETIFNDIYNQCEPDKELVNRLMERVRKEKPKAMPFKPVIAVASAAAGLVLCFAATKLIPSGPNIEVVNPAAGTTTTTTYKSNIITNTEPVFTFETPPGATTAPCYGPWDENTTTPETRPPTDHTWGEDTTDATCAHEENPGITCACTKTTTATLITDESEIETKPIETTVTTDEAAETTAVTQAIVTTTEITTLPPVTETENDVEEDADVESDKEDVIDDEAPLLEDLPIFDTLGEYYVFLSFEKAETAHINYETRANGFISFNHEEMDIQLAEETALSLKDCVRNDDAPLRGENNEYIRYVGISINDAFRIKIRENGTVQFSAENYNGTIKFTTDPSVYDMLYEYAMSIDGDSPIYHIGENNDSDSVDEVPPEE